MKNSELERILKSARVPEESGEYWENFRKRVTAEVRRREQASGGVRGVRPGWGRLEWIPASLRIPVIGFGMAAACVVLTVGLGQVRRSQLRASQLAEAQKCFREIQALFPNQLQAIVFGERGEQLVLAERPDVPVSPPLYLKICGPNGCERVVTFSGQRIRFNGEDFEVLSSRRGEVLLVGERGVWSSAVRVGTRYRIEAQALQDVS